MEVSHGFPIEVGVGVSGVSSATLIPGRSRGFNTKLVSSSQTNFGDSVAHEIIKRSTPKSAVLTTAQIRLSCIFRRYFIDLHCHSNG